MRRRWRSLGSLDDHVVQERKGGKLDIVKETEDVGR